MKRSFPEYGSAAALQQSQAIGDIGMHEGSPAAVVVGLCAHGIAVVHALSDHGVDVHGLEANRANPGIHTRCASVHIIEDINGPSLIDSLIRLHPDVSRSGTPILFLTNDNMVKTIASGWERIRSLYRLSWSHCKDDLCRLIEKSNIAEQCRRTGALYPRTFMLSSLLHIGMLDQQLTYPVIAKPVRPLSGFKVRICRSRTDLESLCHTNGTDMPFLVQNYVSGGEEQTFFCGLYLSRGKIVTRFEGRKLRSRPLGHTTVAQPHPDDQVYSQAEQFFRGLELSGFVSLEVKRDENGKFWVIEPTLGRTDSWIECCTANGINFPYIEYCEQAGKPLPATSQQQNRVWLNVARDAACVPWYVWQIVAGRVKAHFVTFTYARWRDPLPLIANGIELIGTLSRSAIRVLLRHSRQAMKRN